jgi:cell division protein FtsZ
MKINIQNTKRPIIKVLGVGGGGSNAVSFMHTQGIVGVDFAICNTDIQAMELSEVPVKIQLGLNTTEGMGAGSEPEIGRQACLESIEDIRRYLAEGTKMLFITAGMGGGTGTGAAPVIAQLARELDILTVGIVTTPFTFEGGKRAKYGLDGLEEMKKHVDSIIVVSNDKLIEMFGSMKYRQAFSQADNVLATAAKGIAEIITIPGIVNVDFRDVRTIMKDSGVAIMGIGVGEGENRARLAIDSALNSPLLESNNIRGATDILVNITSGEDEVSMEEIAIINDFIQEEAGYGTNLVMGQCFDESLTNEVKVTLIATGFNRQKQATVAQRPSQNTAVSVPNMPTEEVRLDEEITISLDDEYQDELRLSERLKTIEKLRSPQSFTTLDPHIKSELVVTNAVGNPEAPFNHDRSRREELRNQNPKLSSNQVIYDMEREPSYKRRGIVLDDVTVIKDDAHQSRIFFSENDDHGIQEMNPRFKRTWED